MSNENVQDYGNDEDGTHVAINNLERRVKVSLSNIS
jgi:hypothetical protein